MANPRHHRERGARGPGSRHGGGLRPTVRRLESAPLVRRGADRGPDRAVVVAADRWAADPSLPGARSSARRCAMGRHAGVRCHALQISPASPSPRANWTPSSLASGPLRGRRGPRPRPGLTSARRARTHTSTHPLILPHRTSPRASRLRARRDIRAVLRALSGPRPLVAKIHEAAGNAVRSDAKGPGPVRRPVAAPSRTDHVSSCSPRRRRTPLVIVYQHCGGFGQDHRVSARIVVTSPGMRRTRDAGGRDAGGRGCGRTRDAGAAFEDVGAASLTVWPLPAADV